MSRDVIQKNKGGEEEKRKENKYFKNDKFIFQNFWADLISYILILLVIIGTYYLYANLELILEDLKKIKPDYPFPSYSVFLPSIYYLIGLIAFHEFFRIIFADKLQNFLSKRYEFEDPLLIQIYKKKVATNIYKCSFYLFSTIFGYFVLKDLDFFPRSLLGNGEFKNLFKDDYRSAVFYNKPEMMELYYNLNLSFALFDGYILLTNPLQSDFLFMVLHHLATYSLIIYSYMSNYSAVGSMYYFTFYFGDIFSYIVRTLVHLNVPDLWTVYTTFVFLVVFSYTRLYVFGDICYQIYDKISRWEILEVNLFGFSLFLMALNCLWIFLITKKFLKYCFTGNIEEIYKFKLSKSKTN